MGGRGAFLLIMLCAGFVLAPTLTSFLSSESSGEVPPLPNLRQISWQSVGATTDAATTTTSPAQDLDVGALVAAASPFYVHPVVPVDPALAAPPPGFQIAVAPAGPPMPPPASKATRRRSQKGEASWYQIDNGTCAHKALPKGTMVRVVNAENKREIVCRVADRGPFLDGRIIDLDLDDFKRLASRTEGVIEVRINW